MSAETCSGSSHYGMPVRPPISLVVLHEHSITTCTYRRTFKLGVPVPRAVLNKRKLDQTKIGEKGRNDLILDAIDFLFAKMKTENTSQIAHCSLICRLNEDIELWGLIVG